MAGQLTIDTLKASSGVLATQNGMTGIAKAWVNYKGTATVGIRSSFNVSSVTYNAVGNYTINFTTAMADTNYCFEGCGAAGSETTSNATRAVIPVTYSTGSVNAITLFGSGAATDFLYVNVAIFGN